MGSVLTEIIDIMVEGIVSYGAGFGQGLGSVVEAIFLEQSGETTKLSTTGGLIVVFAAIERLGLSDKYTHISTHLSISDAQFIII